MSLISTLMSLGIASMVLSMLVSLSTLTIKNSASIQADNEVLAHVSSIRKALREPEMASKMLKGNRINGIGVILKDPLKPSLSLSKPGQGMSHHWSVKRIGFENVIETDTLGIFKLTVVLIVQKNTKTTIGSPVSRRVVGDAYCKVISGKIDSCDIDLGQAKHQCEALGGVWDGSREFGSQCKLSIRDIASDTGGKPCDR